MDRERLKNVQTSDLTEERLNEDFVLWLKTKGPTWLLVILVAIVAYLFMVNWQQREARYQNEAWIALLDAQLPTSLEDVALQYPDIDSVAQQARLRAANTYLRSIQLDRAIGSTAEAVVPLTEEDRVFNLDRAHLLFEEVLASDTNEQGEVILAVSALNGLAAVQECRGDLESARTYYEEAALRAAQRFPFLAEQSAARAQSVGEYDRLVVIPESVPEPPAIPDTSIDSIPTLEEITSPLLTPLLPDEQAAPDAPGEGDGTP